MSDDFIQRVRIDEGEAEEAVLAFHRETEKAILVSDTGSIKDAVWIPKSQIEYTMLPDGYVSCTIPQWLLEEKGLV